MDADVILACGGIGREVSGEPSLNLKMLKALRIIFVLMNTSGGERVFALKTRKFDDPKKKKTLTASAKNESVVKGDTLKITTRCTSKKQALVQAKAALGRSDTKIEGSLEFVGNPYLIAGLNIEIKGVGHFSGRYHITEARHVFDRISGYKTYCEVESC